MKNPQTPNLKPKKVIKAQIQNSKLKFIYNLLPGAWGLFGIWCLEFGVLLIGAYLRLYRISEYMTFLGDEGRDALVVKRMIVDKKFTLLGPITSIGSFFMGPIYYYFMAPFLWLWRLDPAGPAVMAALFGIAAIFLTFQAGKKFFNPKVGLMASSLYALSPVVITYSHSSWNPNIVPFFSLFYIFALFKAVEEEKWLWWFLAGLAIGIGLQLHYLFGFLILVGPSFVFIFKRGVSYLKKYAVLILGFLTGFSPFLAFELRHRFPNIKTIINFLFKSETTGFAGERAGRVLTDVFFRLFGRLIFNFPSQNFSTYSEKVWGWKAIVWLTAILSLIALLFKIIKRKKPAHVLLFLWLFFGVIPFSFYRGSIYDYYLGILFPLPFLLFSYLLYLLWQKKFFRPVVLAGFTGLVILNWADRPFAHEPNRQLAQTKEIARFVIEKTEQKPYNFALITEQNSDHAYRYFLEIWGHPPTKIQPPQKDLQRKTAAGQLLVVCEDTSCQPLGHSLWEIAGFGRAEIVGEWDVSVVKVYKLIHYQGSL